MAASQEYCLPIMGGEFGSLRQCLAQLPSYAGGLTRRSDAIRSTVIAVQCVVRVDVARGVDVPNIVRVTAIGRPQKAVTGR